MEAENNSMGENVSGTVNEKSRIQDYQSKELNELYITEERL